ncbi:HDOD domain-containing protein [Desulfovibrio ferrophilus]|uniref:diguanylate cyclase n=1 Tax=Desulfovibrio ferrophilus TaxID=241368 RepID=A0A2Z6B2H5_9BACT|nr:HDOD domain-containing protein [Desulfovibrio ferrophilus]BBD09681.1 diguanylate cyclase with PAS/PAC sensor [Desulfovibrio ferrophilus]
MADTTGKTILRSVRKGLEQAFPPVMAQLLRELVKPNPDFSDIAKVIGMDPVMSAAVLNLVNSPFYGLTQKVITLQRAAVVLGTKEILKIALSVSFVKDSKADHKENAEDAFSNWRLVVWSAIAAELIAERLCPELTDQAYLNTLLKDLSLLLMSRAAPEEVPELLRQDSLMCLKPEQLDIERKAWGMSHPELTVRALEEWSIPDLGNECITNHHDVEHLDNYQPMTQAVILATQWSELVNGCDRDPVLLVQFEILMKRKLGVSSEEIEELRLTCLHRFRSMLAILDLAEADPIQRLYEHSVQAMQNLYFQSMEINTVAGGPKSLARVIARHLRWNFDVENWELTLRSPLDESWTLIAPDKDGGIEDRATAELDIDLPWTLTKSRFLLIASGEKWGELRARCAGLSQETLQELALYIRFLSRAYEQYCLRHAVMESKARTLDALPVGVARLDMRGRIVECNNTFYEFLGKPENPKGRDILDCMALLDIIGADTEWRLFLGNDSKDVYSKILCLPNNEGLDTHRCMYLSAHKEGGAGDTSILFLAEDITEVSELEVQALKHGEFMEQLVESMQDLVMTVDASGRITFASPRLSHLLIGRNLFTIAKPVGAFSGSWAPAMLASTEGAVEVIMQLRDGSFKSMELMISLLRGNRPDTPTYLVVGRDLTAVRRLEEKLKRQAIYDGLTDLYNHYQFHALLNREARRSQRTSRPMGLIFFDLDGFKEINDRLGHQAGDQVLRDVAEAIRDKGRQGTDFPCRYGGDEFAVIATDVGDGGLQVLAQRIKKSIDDNLKGEVRISLGLALLEEGESPEMLLKRADHAAYAAKSRGGDQIVEAGE